MASDSPLRLTPIVDCDCDCDWYPGSHPVEKHGRQLRYDPAGFIHTPPSHSPPPCEDCHWYYEDPLSSSAKDDEDGVEDENRKDDDDDDDPSDEDEDEDVRDLPEEAKIHYRDLHSSIDYAPFFSIHFQRFYDKYPCDALKPMILPKKFARSFDDDIFLQQLANATNPWSKQHPYPEHSRDSLAKQAVVDILFRVTEPKSSLWNQVRCDSLAAKDGVYSNAIKAATALLFSLHTKDSLCRLGCQPTLDGQKILLWKELELLRQKGHSVYEASRKIVQLMAEKDIYSFFTECDTGEMLSEYDLQLLIGKFDYRPFSARQGLSLYGHDKIEIRHDIDKVVMEMEPSSPISQVDVYTRMLISLLKDSACKEKMDLVNDAMKVVDSNTMDREKIVVILLHDLLSIEIMRMKSQLILVLQPLYMLSMNILGLRFISHEILMIVQIAELRRMALGSRFIGRSHLIWVIYECGYGTANFRKHTDPHSRDRDHPPYNIYVAAIRMAFTCGLKKVRLEHFMFAVAQDSAFDEFEEYGSNNMLMPLRFFGDYLNFLGIIDRTRFDSYINHV